MIDFTKVGGLVRITVTDELNPDNNGVWFKNRSSAKVDFRVVDDGITNIVFIVVDDLEIQAQGWPDISIEEVENSVFNIPSFGAAIAEVFLEVGSDTLTPGMLNESEFIFGIGQNALFENTGSSNIFAVGRFAAAQNSASGVIAIGAYAASGNTETDIVAFGVESAKDNTGGNVNAFGSQSGRANTGFSINAFGSNAGRNNTAHNLNAFGGSSGYNNTGMSVNGMGANAANTNSGINVNAFGNGAGWFNTFSNVTLFGSEAQADGNKQLVFNNSPYNTRFDFSNITAHRKIFVPNMSGTMAVINTTNNYANDAAAAAGGIPVGGTYHTSGTVKVRLT